MIIPAESLPEETLIAIMQSFITREGTDYGEQELGMGEKEQRLRMRIESGEILIAYDDDSQTINLINARDYDSFLSR